MCRTEPRVLCPVPANAAATADMPSHQLTRSMKPRLPRKLAASARINLNRYWHAFEELMPVSRKVFDESDCNAINENLDNERRLAAMQLAEVEGDTTADSPDSLGRYQPSEERSPITISCQVPTPTSNASFPSFSFENSCLSHESSYFPRISSAASVISSVKSSITPITPYSGDENQPPNSNGSLRLLR